MINLGGPIPISIRPAFWIFAALIGFLYSQSFVGTLIWMGIIFISVLFHELGHALTAMLFGKKPRIELVALGGLTFHDGQDLSSWKQFVITLNGPFFGFILGMLAWLVTKTVTITSPMLFAVVHDIFVINIFWTVVNLIPVLPLDGGQLLRIALEGFFGAKGFRYALVAGVVIAVLISLFFFLTQNIIIGALFFLFAYQSFDLWRRSRKIEESDRQEDFKELLVKAEESLFLGQMDQAISLFTALRDKAKKGIIWSMATQQLGLLEYKVGHREKAYQLLLETKEEIENQAVCILHELAFEAKNYPLVMQLSSRAFQIKQEADVALRNAHVFALQGDVKPAIGWLYAAVEHGFTAMGETINQEAFNSIRNDPQFQKFLHSLEK